MVAPGASLAADSPIPRGIRVHFRGDLINVCSEERPEENVQIQHTHNPILEELGYGLADRLSGRGWTRNSVIIRSTFSNW